MTTSANRSPRPRRRRRLPVLLLATLFVVVPIVEIYVIVQIGQVVGPWWTILLLVAAGFLGSVLVRREGRRAWRALQEALGSGRMPARELADGALILVGGTLLVTPGFLSDVVGLFFVLPVTRPLARGLLARLIARRIVVSGPLGPLGPTRGTTTPPRRGSGADGDQDGRGPGVVQGEVVDPE